MNPDGVIRVPNYRDAVEEETCGPAYEPMGERRHLSVGREGVPNWPRPCDHVCDAQRKPAGERFHMTQAAAEAELAFGRHPLFAVVQPGAFTL